MSAASSKKLHQVASSATRRAIKSSNGDGLAPLPLRSDGKADAILSPSQTQQVKDELLANTQRSVDRGTFGSPTFYVGVEVFFGKDKLPDVEAAIVAGARA